MEASSTHLHVLHVVNLTLLRPVSVIWKVCMTNPIWSPPLTPSQLRCCVKRPWQMNRNTFIENVLKQLSPPFFFFFFLRSTHSASYHISATVKLWFLLSCLWLHRVTVSRKQQLFHTERYFIPLFQWHLTALLWALLFGQHLRCFVQKLNSHFPQMSFHPLVRVQFTPAQSIMQTDPRVDSDLLKWQRDTNLHVRYLKTKSATLIFTSELLSWMW